MTIKRKREILVKHPVVVYAILHNSPPNETQLLQDESQTTANKRNDNRMAAGIVLHS